MTEQTLRSASGSSAEDLFIELFSETFGAEKAGYLYSQYHFYDIYQNDRFADFFLESGTRKIAIEIDDEASHNKNIISQNKFYDDHGILSPRKAFWEQEKMASQKAVRDALDTANMWWRIPASVEADSMINTIVGAYLSDQIDLEEAVKQLDEALTAALKNSPPEAGIKNYNH